MKFKQSRLTALATGVALGAAALGAQAGSGEQTDLSTAGARATAKFAGGATINGGVSYLPQVPASEPADLVVSVRPAAGDVGREADIYVILNVPGQGYFQKISGGIWLPFDPNDLGKLQPYMSKTLGAREQVAVIDGLVGEDANMAGMELMAHLAYAVGGNLANITYNGAAAKLSIAGAAANTCPANTAAQAGESLGGKNVCLLTGTIMSDTHLTSNFAYVLDGKVTIGGNDAAANEDKVMLTIDAGTTVYAQQGGNHYLHIDRGGQLYANGSREKPVVFTYVDEADATSGTRGQWGGLVLNGSAPTNVPGEQPPTGEGGSGEYGGDNPADSSGALTFMQVRYAGYNFNEEDELNGIAFQATGSGTLVDYIQVHNNADDGIEFFGGTTSAKHVLLTGNEDDAVDWTEGWNGKLQFVAVRQSNDSDHCIEADSNGDNNDLEPRASAMISNMTCVAPEGAEKSGFRLREGTSAQLSNVVMGNFPKYCVDIDQNATFIAAGGSISGLNGSLSLTHSRLAESCKLEDEEGDPFMVSAWFNAQAGSQRGDVDLGGSSGLVNGHMLNKVKPMIPADPFFEKVDYIGAIKDETSDWTAGWSFSDWD